MVVKIALYTDRNQLKGFDDELIRRYWNKEIAVLTFETVDTATPADETTSLSYTSTGDLDGTTTPVRFHVKSADPKDVLTGVGARYLHAMGIQAVDSTTAVGAKPACVKESTGTGNNNGTSYWVRFYGMRLAEAGTEGDSAGAITFTAGTKKYATLTAAGGMSTVSHIYVPAGWAACVFRADWVQNQGVTATAHAFYSARYHKFTDEYYNSAGAAATITRDRFAIGMANGASGSVRLRQIPLRAHATTHTSYIAFHGDLITGTLTGSVKFYVLMVKI